MWDRASFHVANPTSPQFCRRQMRHCPDRGSKEAPKRFSMRVSKYFPYCHPDQQMFPRNFFHVYCLTLVNVNKSRPNGNVKGETSAQDVLLPRTWYIRLFAGNAWSWNYKLDSCPAVMSFVSNF